MEEEEAGEEGGEEMVAAEAAEAAAPVAAATEEEEEEEGGEEKAEEGGAEEGEKEEGEADGALGWSVDVAPAGGSVSEVSRASPPPPAASASSRPFEDSSETLPSADSAAVSAEGTAPLQRLGHLHATSETLPARRSPLRCSCE